MTNSPESLKLTMERIDPTLVDSHNRVDVESLRFHIERYEFALPYVRGRHVVDCACGTGYGSYMLSSGADHVTAVDICVEAIQFAKSHHSSSSIEYVVGDAYEFEPSVKPDVWVSLETVEHLRDPREYLLAVHRRLSDSGRLVASVPTTVSSDGNPFHLTDFTRRSWRKMVEAAGFQVEDEIIQVQRFTLRDAVGRRRGERQQGRNGLLRYYFRHPVIAARRLALTATRGFVNEYSVLVAKRK